MDKQGFQAQNGENDQNYLKNENCQQIKLWRYINQNEY